MIRINRETKVGIPAVQLIEAGVGVQLVRSMIQINFVPSFARPDSGSNLFITPVTGPWTMILLVKQKKEEKKWK